METKTKTNVAILNAIADRQKEHKHIDDVMEALAYDLGYESIDLEQYKRCMRAVDRFRLGACSIQELNKVFMTPV